MNTPLGKITKTANRNENQLSPGEAASPEELDNVEPDSAGSTKEISGFSSTAVAGDVSEHGSGHRSGKKKLKKLMKWIPRLPRVSFASMYRTVSLSVEKDVIRVAVFKGRNITSWGTVPLSWAPGELEAANHPEPKPESTDGRRVGGLLKKQKGAPLNLG